MPRKPASVPANKKVISSGGTKWRKLVSRTVSVLDAPKPPVKKAKAPRVNINGRKTKPTYLNMIKKAIKENGGRGGASYAAISGYIIANYPIKIQTFSRHLKVQLKRLVEEGSLKRINASYKLSAKESKKKSKRKSSKKTKKTKKTTTKKDGTKKKATKKTKKSGDKKTKKTKKPTAKKAAAAPKKRAAKAPKQRKNASASSSEEAGETSAASGELVWAWQYYHDGWYNYDEEASNVVEATYQDYLKNPRQTDVRSVESGEWSYMVDFRQMTQQNLKHDAHTTRKIRRYQIPKSDFEVKKKYA